MVCLSVSSSFVNEEQGSLILTLILTNASSNDIKISVFTTNGTATGKHNSIVYTCTCTHVYNVCTYTAEIIIKPGTYWLQASACLVS